jgi:hypothetical protein
VLYDPNIVRVMLADGRVLDVPRDARCAFQRFAAYSAPSYWLLRVASPPGSLPLGTFGRPGAPEFEAHFGPIHAFRGECVLVELSPMAAEWSVAMVETEAQALARAESEILRLASTRMRAAVH